MRKPAIAFGLVLSATTAAHALITAQVIDRGVPTDGVQTLQGFRGFTVRVVSDAEPITGFEFRSGSGGGVVGGMLFRWEDPTAQSNYTLASPGLYSEQNLTPSALNFDSHLLGDPSQVIITQPLIERVGGRGFNLRTNLVSTPSVGYGATYEAPNFDPFSTSTGGQIAGEYTFLPQFQPTVFDVAYVVTDSLAIANFSVRTSLRSVGLGVPVYVPEPSSVATCIGFTLLSLLRPTRRRKVETEALESRRLLTLAIPSGVQASVDPLSHEVVISWNDITVL